MENALCATEKWPSRWCLGKICADLLERVSPVRWQRTSRALPVRKGKTMRKLSDVRVCYVPFSAHVFRDFADLVTVDLFHDAGDSALGSVDRTVEVFQTLAARESSHFNFPRGFRLNGDWYKVGYTMRLFLYSVENMDAHLVSTGNADDGEAALSEAMRCTPYRHLFGWETSQIRSGAASTAACKRPTRGSSILDDHHSRVRSPF